MISARKDERGFILAMDFKNLPFIPVMAFTVSDVPVLTTRGKHAHRNTSQCLICVHGSVDVSLIYFEKDLERTKSVRMHPGQTITISPMVWNKQVYHKDTVVLVYCDRPYDESDCIRDYDQFVELNLNRNNPSQ